MISSASVCVASIACAVFGGLAGHAAKRGDRRALWVWVAAGALVLLANMAIQIAAWR